MRLNFTMKIKKHYVYFKSIHFFMPGICMGRPEELLKCN